MESKLPASLFTAHRAPSLSNSGSFPIRAPPSFDEEIDSKKPINGSDRSSESESDFSSERERYLSGDDDFETAVEPDEETLEMEEGEDAVPFVTSEGKMFPFVESEGFSQRAMIPIAQLSGEFDDDEGLISEVDEDGVFGVVRVRVPQSSSKMDGTSLVENPGIRVLDGEEKDPLEIAEKDGNGVLGCEEKDPSLESGVVENSIGVESGGDGGSGVVETISKEDTLQVNPTEESINLGVEESPAIESRELESIKTKGFDAEEKNEVLGSKPIINQNYTIGGDSSAELEIGVVGGFEEHGDSETPLVEDAVVGKSVPKSGESGQVSPVIEQVVDSKFDEAGGNVVVENDIVGNGGSDQSLESVLSAVSKIPEPEFQELKSGVAEVEHGGILVSEPVVHQNSVAGGSSAVETENSKFHGSAPVEGFEENETSEATGLEVVEESAGLDGVSDQASPVTEEVVDSKFDVGADAGVVEKNKAIGNGSSDQNLESVTNTIVENPEPEFHESKTGSDKNLVSVTNTIVENPEPEFHESETGDKDEDLDAGPVSVDVARNEPLEKLDIVDINESASPAESNIDKEESNIDKEVKSHIIVSEGPECSDKSNEVAHVIAPGDILKDGVVADNHTHEPAISTENMALSSVSCSKVKDDINDSLDAEDEENADLNDAEDEGSVSEEHVEGLIFGGSETAEQIMKEMEQGSSSAQSGFGSSQDNSQRIDGQIISDSDEEVDTDEEGDGKELFDSAALAALLKAAGSAAPDGSVTITSRDAARFFSVERPAGLGSSIPSLKPAPRSNRPSIFAPSDLAVVGENTDNNMDEEEKKMQEKIHQIRVKFLRLVQRLGHSPEDTVAAQVLYRLNLAEGLRRGRQTSRAFSLEAARKAASQLETVGKEDLEFSINVLILGKSGVGKSATINSIFGEEKTPISAFEPATTTVKEITGTVDGVNLRVIDTPGLKHSVMDQTFNRRILSSIKKFTKKCPPDIVLYIDRLDTQTRDFNDLPLLRSISSTLGSSIWFNAIVALTHAASAPPDGPTGSPLSYEVFVTQRSHVVQHSIRQAAGDMRLMNPVALVENHPSCRRNREGQRVLPNGQNWRSQLLLLCYSSKILSEANSLLKLQDPSAGKLFGFRVRSPPLPFLLSSLLQSRAHPKLSSDQGGEIDDSDIDLADFSDSDQEGEEDEYDQLPPFKPLKKSQIAKLSKDQRKAYFDEYDYRVKLLQKKQWKEELKRLRESKKKGKGGQNDIGYGDMGEDFDQENGIPAAVPVPLPDMVLPPSFDGDNPAYRYRFLEPTSQLLTRPVLDTHGWDHDCGYDGVSIEESLAIASRFPAAVAVQITKDKKEFNIHLDSSVSTKHGENGSTLAGFDIQTVGKQLAYILRGETKFKNLKKNKTVAGVSVTFLGENVATGLKIEDQISIGKRVSLVGSTGAIRSQGDVAYGANLEARLKEKDFPIGQDQSTLGLSLMRWRGDLALGANLQSQFSIGRNNKMAVRVGLNNKLSGQITVRTSSSEQLQIALVGIIPIVASIFRTFWVGEL
ncbi:translocase of chloroplast 159, chloroplastic-like [Tasmannia lanceolata]|uniref:translocase of chloroplast 159, chloroplastic-like n=1 Tax=Tasmannia lanceolata TaxID=3420 RepID=UPI00406363E5